MESVAIILEYIVMRTLPAFPSSTFHREVHPPTPQPYRVHTLGHVYDQPYHATLGTYQRDAMFTLFLGGKGTYLQGKREISIGKGMTGLVLPSRNPGLLLADPADPYDHYYCRFSGAEAMRTARRISAEHRGEPFFPWEDSRAVIELLQRMIREGNANQASTAKRTRPIDAMLAELLSRLDCPPSETGDELTARNLQRYMEDHLAEPANLQAVADHFGFSRCYLCRAAKPLLGETLMDAFSRMKIDWARTLLRASPLSIAHVARRVGYQDAFYFSKVFRKYTGQSPREWRMGKRRVIG